jgi:hypothetical protein
MKAKHINILLAFLCIYTLVLIIFIIKFQVSREALIRLIFSCAGMIAILVINRKDKSRFVVVFSTISFFYFFCDPFFSMCNSFLKSGSLVFKNESFLSHTEGFILFTSIGIILYGLLKKNNE